MKGTFLSTSASRIAAPFFCNIQGGLDKGLYLSEALQSLSFLAYLSLEDVPLI